MFIMSERERHAFLVRCSLLAVLVGTAACSDNGGITSGGGHLIDVSGIPAPDSAVQQLGILLTVHLDPSLDSLGSCIFRLDGTVASGGFCIGPTFIVGAPVLTPGTHTAEFSFAGTSSAAQLDRTFTFTTVPPKIDPYSLTELPPLPGDVSAAATDMNESGTVVGSSTRSDGTTRPVRWIDGQVSELPDPDDAPGGAVSINAEGTIVGRLDSASVAWTTNDSIVVLGYHKTRIVRINDAGQILFQPYSRTTVPYRVFMIYDLASRTATEIPVDVNADLRAFNNKGQVLGFDLSPASKQQYPGLMQYGGVSIPSVDAAYVAQPFWNPVDLNDAGEVLTVANGWEVFGTAASSVVLNPFFSGGHVDRANNQDVVAGIGPQKTPSLWRKSANVAEQVDVGGGWTFNRVIKLSDNGAILAVATTSSGQVETVLLTPND